MARAIWSGAISFGLVNVPVRLYTATDVKDVHFREIDAKTKKRIHHKRVTEGSKREVDYKDVAKGYEVSKGKYVVLSKDELEAADPEKNRTIELEDFVDLAEIDPVYFEKHYYLGPDKNTGAKKAYALLMHALEDTERIGIARFVMRTKEYLAAIRPSDGVLVLDTMFFPDEVRDPKDVLEETPSRVKTEAKDLQMAKRLVDQLTVEWQPSKYKDRYRRRVLDIVHKKQKGEEIVVDTEAEEAEAPSDLMEALKASVEAMGSRKKSAAKRTRRKAS